MNDIIWGTPPPKRTAHAQFSLKFKLRYQWTLQRRIIKRHKVNCWWYLCLYAYILIYIYTHIGATNYFPFILLNYVKGRQAQFSWRTQVHGHLFKLDKSANALEYTCTLQATNSFTESEIAYFSEELTQKLQIQS